MEINRYLEEYKKYSAKEFYDWASQGRVMEVRFLANYKGEKFNNWDLIKVLADKFNLEYRYNSLYITSFDQLKQILLFRIRNKPLTRLYNIYMSVNPKRKVNVKSARGLIYKSYYGGIAGTSHIQNIAADIEHVGIRDGNATEEMLEECVNGAKYLVKILDLKDFYINISGNGTHLWFRLEEAIELPVPSFTEFKDKLKYNLKEEAIAIWIKRYNKFIEKLDKYLKEFNPKLKVDDGAKDLSRVLRPVGSWNVKAGKTARAVGTVYKENQINNIINKKFTAVLPFLNKKARTIIKAAKITSNHRYNLLNIRECPLFKLMVNQYLPSILSRNHYLEQSYARILRDNEICVDDVADLIDEMSEIQNKTVQVDPDYLGDDDPFNSEMVNSYCIACKIDLVYPLLEEYPVVQENIIDDERYANLNSYSDVTIQKLIPKDCNLENIDSYLELKKVMRNLVDEYDKTTVFFIIKNHLKKDWEYYDKNKIIQQLINKMRKQEQ